MATFSAASSGFGPTSGGGNTRTVSFSVAAGGKAAILVSSDDALPNSLAWGAATLTLRQSYNIGNVGYEALYTTDNPPSSATNIIAGFSSGQFNTCIQAISAVPGAGNTLTYRGSNKATDASGFAANKEVSLTTVSGDACVALGAIGYGGSSGGIDFDDYNGAAIRVESEDGSYTGAFASSKTASGTSTNIGAALVSDGASWDVFGVAWEEAASGGSSQDLTGTAVSTSQGSIASSTAKALAGTSGSVSLGTIAPVASHALTGQEISSSLGTQTPSVAIGLTGQQITVSQGDISPNDQEGDTLTGEGVGIGQGTINPAIAKSLTGQSTAFIQGSIAPAISITLSGQVIPCSLGSVSVGEDIGYSLRIDLGSAHAAVSLTLSGHEIGVSLGSIISSSLESQISPEYIYVIHPYDYIYSVRREENVYVINRKLSS